MSEAVRIFRNMVNERGDGLRELHFNVLKQLAQPTEFVAVGNRRGKVSIIINHLPSGGILVVVQGFLKHRFLPMVWSVALDGFYKYPDETMAPMTREDMYSFD
jgi:hypothetical protein